MIRYFYSIHRWNLTATNTPNQSGPESNGNEKVLHILQSFGTRASLLDGLMSYPEYSLWVGESYLSAEMQSAYSTAEAEWAVIGLIEWLVLTACQPV